MLSIDEIKRLAGQFHTDELNVAREYAQQKADEFRAAAHAALDETGIKNRAMDKLRDAAELMTRRVR